MSDSVVLLGEHLPGPGGLALHELGAEVFAGDGRGGLVREHSGVGRAVGCVLTGRLPAEADVNDIGRLRLCSSRLQRQLGQGAVAVIAAYRSDRPDASPADLYLAIQSARRMGEGSVLIAERKAAQGGAPAYYYNLAYKSAKRAPGVPRELGAMHAIDIPLKYKK